MPKIWVGRMTLNEEKKGNGLVGLTLTLLIWGRNLALYIELKSVKSILKLNRYERFQSENRECSRCRQNLVFSRRRYTEDPQKYIIGNQRESLKEFALI